MRWLRPAHVSTTQDSCKNGRQVYVPWTVPAPDGPPCDAGGLPRACNFDTPWSQGVHSMLKKYLAIFAVLAVLPHFSFGADVTQSDPLSQEEAEAIFLDDAAEAEALHGPVFLGCVHSEHDCEHRAHEAGYHHHYTRSDHRRCGHHHVACIAY